MGEVCRTCLKVDEGSSNDFIPFSYQIKDNLPVREVYQLLINKMEDQNRDESKICRDCLLQLETFYEYRCQTIRNNDQYLERKLNSIKQEISSEDPFLFLQIKMEEDSAPIQEEAKESSKRHRDKSPISIKYSRNFYDKPTRKSKSLKIKSEESQNSSSFNYQNHGSLLPEEEGMSIFKRRYIIDIQYLHYISD